MFGPWAVAGDVASAGLSTWTNSPPDWGTHWKGFEKRLGSEIGKSVLKETTAFGLEEAFKLDSHYYRLGKKYSVGSRIKDAFLSAVTTKTATGHRIVGFPRIAGGYVSTIAATKLWYPKRFTYKDAFRSGTWSIAGDILSNLITEFIHR